MTAFTSGIILFRNSDCIKVLFDTIKAHATDYIKYNAIPICLDQPFIVYNAISQNKYDNQLLKLYAENNPSIANEEKIIYHFPGGPGHYDSKVAKMANFWENMNKIPKILFQTHKTNLDKYVLDRIHDNLTPEWKYEFYDDNDVIQFFINNPLADLPDIIKKYNSIKKGAHKADLFRYYYLYINGGFFMDSDAMLCANIDTIVKNYNFISVNSYSHPGTIFQGILGTSPKNQIIKKALYNAYNTDPAILETNYHYFCRQMYDIIIKCNFGYKIKLYEERRINQRNMDNIVEGDAVLFKHYWSTKIIPKYNNLLDFDTKYGTIFLNENDKYFIDIFCNNKYWDEDNLCILKDKYIPNDKNILEIGGHAGTSSIFYSRYLKDNNIIYTFEPQKKMFDILNINVQTNNLTSKIKTFNSGIFCKTGKINMHTEDLDGPSKGNITLLENNNKSINYGGICLGKEGELTTCIKLDDLDFENIGYIHCDAQGSEPFIFSSATQFIKKHRPVILYENSDLYGDYLFNTIKSAYPEFLENSKFNIKNYCVNELGYYCILNFNNSGFDSLLLPYLYTDWNNYNKNELNKFDYRVLNTYKISNNLVRVGPNEDGGYVIADGLEYDLFISCGIADDICFEDAFLDIHKIKCIAFDGTINSFPSCRNSIEWIPKNIGYLNTEKITNLKEYIKDNKKIFLKMDIEGSEFNWIDSMTKEELENFSQIVLEVHWPFDVYRMNMLKKLNETHYIIHIHGNNYCDRDIPKHLPSGRSYDGTVTINNGALIQVNLPEVFEVTYVNKKLFDNVLIKMKEIKFPTILDYPNNPNAKEIYFSIPVIKFKSLENTKYSWGDSSITFLENGKMDAFGHGTYTQQDTYTFKAIFGSRIHLLIFNNNYTEFTSTRHDDNQIMKGKLL
jgi:FkbM family methyltransferase